MKLVRLSMAGFLMSLSRSLTFRINLVFDVLLAVVGLGASLATVLVVFSQTESLAGWTKAEALALIGTFQLMAGLKATFIDPNLAWFPENGIRNGKLDTYLLQPAPSLYLASLAMASPLALLESFLGLGVIAFSIAEHGQLPSLAGLLAWLALSIVGIIVTWAIGVLFACLAFWAPRLQLDIFYGSAWQFARYPIDIYQGPLRFVLTYIFPMALVAPIPAATLLRGPQLSVMVASVGAAGVSALIAVSCWQLGLRRYTGATS